MNKLFHKFSNPAICTSIPNSVKQKLDCFCFCSTCMQESGTGATVWGAQWWWSIGPWLRPADSNTQCCLSGLCCCLSGSRLWYFSGRKSVCIVQCRSVALCSICRCSRCSFSQGFWTQSRTQSSVSSQNTSDWSCLAFVCQVICQGRCVACETKKEFLSFFYFRNGCMSMLATWILWFQVPHVWPSDIWQGVTVTLTYNFYQEHFAVNKTCLERKIPPNNNASSWPHSYLSLRLHLMFKVFHYCQCKCLFILDLIKGLTILNLPSGPNSL